MRISLLVSASLVFAGCKSDETKRDETIAARANPVINQLRPFAATVLHSNSDAKTVRVACEKGIEILRRLNVKFEDRDGNDEHAGADDALQGIAMGEASTYCKPDTGDGTRDSTCADWCRQIFSGLADGISRVHDRAAKEHVQIETLTP